MSNPESLSSFYITESGAFNGYSIYYYEGDFWHTSLVDGVEKRRRLPKPSKEKWAVFWSALDQLSIRNWQKSYTQEEVGVVVDGGSKWAIEFSWGNQSISSSGKNSFPVFQQGKELNPTFEKSKSFLAVERLVAKLFDLQSL